MGKLRWAVSASAPGAGRDAKPDPIHTIRPYLARAIRGGRGPSPAKAGLSSHLLAAAPAAGLAQPPPIGPDLRRSDQ